MCKALGSIPSTIVTTELRPFKKSAPKPREKEFQGDNGDIFHLKNENNWKSFES
jgi:hypothetical protein